MLYQLVNTETEEVESIQEMTEVEASERNFTLREYQEPHRWVPYRGEDEEEY